MGITLGSNFTVNTNLPLDDRMQVADNTARDALVSGRRYEGLIVYSVAAGVNYQLVGGILNANWTALGGSGSGVTVVADITARDAILAGSRTEGMIVYVNSDDTHYTLKAGILNANWAVLSGLATVNYSVDSFNGTGSQTAFTLTTNPATENNTFVYVNGVYQEKDTYSVSGTTLTFSEAPPIGTTNIEVCYTVPLAIGTPSDDTVSTVKIQNLAVTSAKLADGAVTNAKKGAPNFVESGIAPNFGSTSTSYVNVTNMSLSFTTTGRLLEFGLNPTNSASHRIQLLTASSTSGLLGFMQFYNDTSTSSICEIPIGNEYPSSSTFYTIHAPCGGIRAFAQPAAGTYTFRLRIRVNSTSMNLVLDQVKMFVREL
jgi:hypothetical protein